jgi:hypothetical protein
MVSSLTAGGVEEGEIACCDASVSSFVYSRFGVMLRLAIHVI